MKRELWNKNLYTDSTPPWPCPTCEIGFLALVPGSLIYKESANSKKEHSDSEWQPEWITYVFTAWLKCNNNHCGEDVVVSGTGEETNWNPEEFSEWTPHFIPKFCLPMPDIFKIPPKCPKNISNEIRLAFSVFWSDHCSSAAHIRLVLELLMDNHGIPVNSKLHKRIEQFQSTNVKIGDQLMSLKWLGNTSVHEGDVSREDVLDAFEILEYVLFELIERRSEKVEEMSKTLTDKHNPETRRMSATE